MRRKPCKTAPRRDPTLPKHTETPQDVPKTSSNHHPTAARRLQDTTMSFRATKTLISNRSRIRSLHRLCSLIIAVTLPVTTDRNSTHTQPLVFKEQSSFETSYRVSCSRTKIFGAREVRLHPKHERKSNSGTIPNHLEITSGAALLSKRDLDRRHMSRDTPRLQNSRTFSQV